MAAAMRTTTTSNQVSASHSPMGGPQPAISTLAAILVIVIIAVMMMMMHAQPGEGGAGERTEKRGVRNGGGSRVTAVAMETEEERLEGDADGGGHTAAQPTKVEKKERHADEPQAVVVPPSSPTSSPTRGTPLWLLP